MPPVHLSSERWSRITAIFGAARDTPNEQRDALVRERCGDDEALADEVRALLLAHDAAANDFLTPQSLARYAGLLEPNAPSALPGAALGPYIVERELGRGGMAIVYLARDPRLEREVALKLLPVASSGDAHARNRLVAEARAISRLDHPNIATVYDIGETDDGRVWVAMARYTGETLRDRIARGALPATEALDIARQVGAGLAAAHARGIVHRDVKPENVIVTADGVAKLLDFGIAKGVGAALTRSGMILGTLHYMSPEQTFGDEVDARADVWALGVVLYEMLDGRRPFDGKPDAVLISAIRHDAPRPLTAQQWPNALSGIVERCLQKEAANRFASMAELLHALATASGATPRGPRWHSPWRAPALPSASRSSITGCASCTCSSR